MSRFHSTDHERGVRRDDSAPGRTPNDRITIERDRIRPNTTCSREAR
jgi:hypothetical protein